MMKFGRIPHLDKPVPRIVAGADWLMDAPPREAFRTLDAYWEAGGRAFDTAHVYNEASLLLGAWKRSRGIDDEIIHFDKVGHPVYRDGVKTSRVRRGVIREELDRNSDWLGAERIDILVLHRDDPDVPVGEIVDWMDELKREGRISAYGGSNWSHERIKAANGYAAASRRQPFSLSNPNLTLAKNQQPIWEDCLTIGSEGRRWHEESGLPLFAWSSTARGYFAGATDPDVLRAYDGPVSRERRSRAEQMARERGVGPVSIALAWTLAQPFPVFALSGMRTQEQVRENLAVLDLELTSKESHWLEFGDDSEESRQLPRA